MSYPINDIFEGTGDLLIKHGKIESNKHIYASRLISLYYGGFTYLLSYESGVLLEITRIESKEDEHGKD